MSKNERIEKLVELAKSLPAQSCENLVCVAEGMAIAANLSAQQKLA